MKHFSGTTADERYKNNVLSELIKIRELLEHNAQVVEQPKRSKSRTNTDKG